ncbi:MAG: hypothetical protein WBB74_07925 [Gaiellaceae bacterium]
MKAWAVFVPLLAALLAAGCGSTAKDVSRSDQSRSAAATACPAAWRDGWQKLADRIQADVYCPSWMPDPLDGKIQGQWNNVNSVSGDRSYLISFAWFEQGEEKHVNFRGYPGRARLPTCIGEDNRSRVPCFEDPAGTFRANGIKATLYTVNHGADQWHLLYAWRQNGSLYSLSQHVAPPLSYGQVLGNLRHELASLVLVHAKS